MAKDYALIAKTITENLGTISNIESVTHCMTRLRVSLKDDSKVNVDKIKKIIGVIGYVNHCYNMNWFKLCCISCY